MAPCNMDTELFMECDEEELEPWQQVDDSVEEDDMDFMDNYGEPGESQDQVQTLKPVLDPSRTRTRLSPSLSLHAVEDSPSPLPVSETPPPRTPPPITPAATGMSVVSPRCHGDVVCLDVQGFPVQTVVNPGAPLVLNLQPGQTVQPLTLIRSPSLGQLVRPSVGVSPVRPGPASSGGPAQPGSTFTAMQLPATLTIRTSTPAPGDGRSQHTEGGWVPRPPLGFSQWRHQSHSPQQRYTNNLSVLVCAQICGVLPVCVSPAPTAARSAPSTVGTNSADSTRVVMSVEEFYYGTFEGDLSLRKPLPLGIKTSTFTCQICSHLSENNLRLMQHMLQHSELINGGGDDDRKCCRFCYRQFSSDAQLQSHEDQVHGPTLSSCMCRICEWAFESEPLFLNHMKSNHKPGEMPYVCQVCSYRSSFYSDVLQHFASFHRDSCFLLCIFCLKVTRNPVSYRQHLLKHQVSTNAFHCNRCRLQFVFLKDKMQHKLENHRSFRRPPQLEGLPPGSKVASLVRVSSGDHQDLRQDEALGDIRRKPPPPEPRLPHPVCLRSSCRRSGDDDRLVCLECGTDASDFSAHYPTHVHCLLCPYSSCCSRAYAAHMIKLVLALPMKLRLLIFFFSSSPLSPFHLQCLRCEFRSQTADLMANHLLMNSEHHSATCRIRSKTDLDFSDDERLDDLDDAEETEEVKEDLIKDVKHPEFHMPSTANGHAQPPAIAPASKEDFLTARQLRIALSALCDGLRQAARVFATEAPLIRSWLKDARKRLKETEQKVQTNGADRMVAWVLSMREQQLPITESNLFQKASTLKKKGGFSDSFRISYDWAVNFMLKHRLGVRSSGRAATLDRILPRFLEAKVKTFREFTQKIMQAHKLTKSTVAAMDELCIFVDLRLVQEKSRRSEALEFTGSLPLLTVYLTVLADGTMLPALVLGNRKLNERDLPEFILLEASSEGLSVEEALDLWINKVWLRTGPAQHSKSMLVLDRHREHLGDHFLTSISSSGTLPAVIPGGCSFCLQPLEICMKPVLQRFLLSRWSEFTARNPVEIKETSPQSLQANVGQVLFDWLVEALTHLNKVPQLWKKSFDLTGLLVGPKEDNVELDNRTTADKRGGIQSELLTMLTEILLGAEASETESPDLLELEDEEDSEEEEQAVKEETSEENQEDKKDEEKKEKEDREETGKDRLAGLDLVARKCPSDYDSS
uniref:HTH CENPB-type domain-containing protein n=1 Tax=Neolamprologus brichardi TaxID=32507 RepID=A0A3Q4GUW2_NEOBR